MRILLVFILVSFVVNSYSQNAIGDKEQLAYELIGAKAQSSVVKANERLLESEALFNKITELQLEEQSIDPNDDKHLRKIKSEIAELQVKYYEKLTEGKQAKTKVYQAYLSDYLSINTDSEASIRKEIADDYKATAETQIAQIKKEKSLVKRMDLYRSADLQYTLAIENYVDGIVKETVLPVTENPVPHSASESVNTIPKTDIMDSISLDEGMMDIYNRVNSENLFNIRDSINYLLGDGYSLTEIFNRWNMYDVQESYGISENKGLAKEEHNVLNTEITADKSTHDQAASNLNTDDIQLAESQDVDTESESQVSESQETANSNTYPSSSGKADEAKSQSNEARFNKGSENTWYFVQIAASKTPLTIQQVRNIYAGNYSVYVIYEAGWYKYQIGKTRSFQKLPWLVKNCNVPDAYVVAYREGELLKLYEAKKRSSKRSTEKEYVVQIAASRQALSDEVIRSFYSLPLPYSLKLEEGWYKYQIFAGSTYTEAKNLMRQISKEDAFIVVYENGIKKK